MQTQQMAHAQIAIPSDNLELLTSLVNKLGGKVIPVMYPTPPYDPMPNVERGGNMLNVLRRRAGLTQNEVANVLKIPQSHISEFERDKRKIPFKHARKLAALLHTLPSHFMRPNSETLNAMAELEKDKGQRFASAENFFNDLGI